LLYGHPRTDPHTDRTVIERDGLRTILVPVPDESQAPAASLARTGTPYPDVFTPPSLTAASLSDLAAQLDREGAQ
jgi:hypothetical protein